jgi:hypothetical protein
VFHEDWKSPSTLLRSKRSAQAAVAAARLGAQFSQGQLTATAFACGRTDQIHETRKTIFRFPKRIVLTPSKGPWQAAAEIFAYSEEQPS